MSDKRLSEASIQDLQLELLRRTQFNEFFGDRVAASLERHRNLWRSAMLMRLGVERNRDEFPAMSLIALRDLPSNRWNSDLLVILCESLEKAEQLKEAAESEDWDADDYSFTDGDELSGAIGLYPADDMVVLSAWWD